MSAPRRFEFVQHDDGEPLAEGVRWSDGTVATRWLDLWPRSTHWDSGIDGLLNTHGQGGRFTIRWIDPPSASPMSDHDDPRHPDSPQSWQLSP